MRLTITLARGILWFEPLILIVIALAFWYPTPTRTDWLWLLWLLVPILIARSVIHRRILTRTPLDIVFIAFLVLGAINVAAAPYTRGLMMLARPLYGIALYYTLVERARESDNLWGLVQVIVILALLIGLLAIGATQWSVDKLGSLSGITEMLPAIRWTVISGGFNPNEIAGAVTWLLGFTGGIAVYRWQQRGLRWDVTLVFVLLLAAILLGQSRSAVAGICVAFTLLALLVRGRWRWAAGLLVIAIIALEVMMFASDIVPRSTGKTSNPQSSESGETVARQDTSKMESEVGVRIAIWESALAITYDHPVFGVGLSMFRDGRVRSQYPILEGRSMPHAHNEVLQILTDMGIPGLAVFLALYLVAGWMLVQSWNRGDEAVRAITAAVAAGFLAHIIFGMADAIPLWDRFAFIFWLMLGMVGAIYTYVQKASPPRSLEQS